MKTHFSLYLLFVIIFTSATSVFAGSQIPDIERKALISIYLNTNGDKWRSNKGWKDNQLESDEFSKSGTECDWFGVNCDEKKEGVIAIELCANKLSGKLPADIGAFEKLERLNLWVNNISGTIPDEICKLNHLELLSLGSNQFSGNIPAKIGNLKNLKYLYFNTNSLTGTIPKGICSLSKLEILSLHTNKLTGNIPDNIGRLINLRELLLFQNDLSGEIPEDIGALKKLEQLNVHSNKLSGLIPNSITNLTRLTDHESNFCGNMLYTDNDVTKEFLNKKQFGIMWKKCQNPKVSERINESIAEAHERITKNSILSHFIEKITGDNFNEAIMLLHPKLREAWTLERFSNDWKSAKGQLSGKWKPEATGSFSGNSPQGPYEQASYRLSSDWRSLSSIDLVSMKEKWNFDGGPCCQQALEL